MYTKSAEVNVRSAPVVSSDNKVATIKEFGKSVHVIGKTNYKDNAWYYVEYNGEKVFIHANMLSDSVASGSTEVTSDVIFNLFVVSAKHKDLPYPKKASSSSNTWDCADCCGYVQVLFKEVLGINLGRSVPEQMRNATKISWDEARPGDLVCTTHDPYTGGDHVGIYIGKVDGHYWYLSQSKYHVHIGYMEGSSKHGNYREEYAPYRVTDKKTSKTAEEIFNYLIEQGVRKNNY